MGALDAPSDESVAFGCSPVGCAFPSGVVRIGWGSKPPEPLADLTPTAAANPRVREDPEPLTLTCAAWTRTRPSLRHPAQGAPSAPDLPSRSRSHAKGKPSPRPRAPAPSADAAPPIALRLSTTTVGAIHEHTWAGEVLPPSSLPSALRRLTATDPSLDGDPGRTAVVPILEVSAPARLSICSSSSITIASAPAAAPRRSCPSTCLSIPRSRPTAPTARSSSSTPIAGTSGLSRGEATTSARTLCVSLTSRTRASRWRRGSRAGVLRSPATRPRRGRSSPARSIPARRGGAAHGAGAGSMGSRRRARAGRRRTGLRGGAARDAAGVGRKGEALFEEQVTASAIVVAGGGDRVCVEAVEAGAARRRGGAAPDAGARDGTSAWSEGGTVRGGCGVAGRRE